MNDATSAREDEERGLLGAVARERDREAYRALFDRYYPRVFMFVQRRLGDRELAREVVNDVFFEIWSSAASFRGDSKISSWIFGVARFKCLEASRNRGRFKRARVVAAGDETISRVASPLDPGARMESRDDLARVASALERLPRAQREALELNVLEGLGLDQVAERQRVSRDTVKTRISRARKGLRRMLGAVEGSQA